MPLPPQIPGVYIPEINSPVKTIVGVSTATPVLIGTFPSGLPFTPKKVRSHQEGDRIFGGLQTNHLSSLVMKQFFENGGKEIWIVSIGRTTRGQPKLLLKGLLQLSHIPSFTILLIPETTHLSDREAAKVFQTAIPIIEQQRAVYLIDPPQQDAIRQSVKSLALWYKSQPFIRHPNLILYHPRIHIPSMASAALPITIPPSGTLAGLFARLDETRGVWKAPAGMEATLMGVMGLEQLLTSQDVTLLESGNINALKQTSPTTFVAWGSRTLSPDPEWRYVPVRRTALFLESSIKQGLTWTVFEPNDEPLWKQIRQSVGDFLTSLFRQGAFQGTKPQDAFFVKCGRDTITANDQAAGLLHILVGFAPLKPAEFVTLRISQKVSPRP